MILNNLYSYDKIDFDDKSALFLSNLITKISKDKSKITIALSGGNSPLPIFKKLRTFNLEWDKINFFIVDERCVGIHDKENNYNNINEVFFKHIRSKSFPIIKYNLSFEQAALKYQDKIAKTCEIVNNLPQFDLIVLGMGLDGHTASLFPNTQAINNFRELVTLNQVPQLNAQRITFTYQLILNSRKIALLIKGEEKKRVLIEATSKNYPIAKVLPRIDYIITS